MQFKPKICALILAASLCLPASVLAQYDSEFMQARSVRVIAKGVGKTRASSGFLWQNANQVVTSLHAVPGGSQISVECRGVRQPATVLKTLAKADLILLSTSGLPASCAPFASLQKTKPQPYTPLWTFGYHAGARSGTSRKFEKGDATTERLDSLVSGAPLRALKAFGIPATNLDIYYVEGGLLPGYSGGPVVDKNKQLIGIVDGGLNKGQSAYNWVIPAKYLEELVASNTSTIPPQVAQSSERHFSTGIEESDEQSTIEYKQDDELYSWVLTKTQSLYELGQTADDAEGVGQLLDVFAQSAGVTAAEQLVFDIYEEQSRGLIIAVPSGQGLVYTADEDGDEWLVSENSDQSAGFNGLRFAYADWDIYDDIKQVISPESPDYFQHLLTELLLECNEPGQSSCQLDPTMMRMIDFGRGNKILRTAIITYDYNGNPVNYDYYSFAVSNNAPFGAQARIQPQGESGLLQCLGSNGGACENTAAARAQLSQLVSSHLTSFSGLAVGANQKVLQTEFVYDNRWDDPTTHFVAYYEGQEVRFFNTRGKEWKVYFNGDYEIATEVRRDEGSQGEGQYVVLQYEDLFYSLPVAGGNYYQSTADGQWAPVGTVVAYRPQGQ